LVAGVGVSGGTVAQDVVILERALRVAATPALAASRRMVDHIPQMIACRAGFRAWAVISPAPVHPGMTG